MDKPDLDRWSGKSAEIVLIESFHELRNPIILVTGYLNLLKTTDLSEEHVPQFIDLAFNYAVSTKDIVDSVYQYMKTDKVDQ